MSYTVLKVVLFILMKTTGKLKINTSRTIR